MKSTHCASTGNCVDVEFHKSSYSNGASACVEIGMFAKSSFSGGNGNCVEVTGDSDGVNYEIVVRDTKQADAEGVNHGPTLRYTPAEWLAFIKGVKDGQFDLAPELLAAAEAELATAS